MKTLTQKLFASACILLTALTSFAQEGKPASPLPSAASADYVLQPSDLISVQVFQEDNLKRDLRVSQENTITLPLIGKVDVKNRTIRQAENIIRDLYDRDYLVNPQINIIVIEYARRSVNVIGNVGSPGIVPFPPEEGLTLVDAISRSGGITRMGEAKRVTLTRTAPDGTTTTSTINFNEILKSKGSNIQLKENDVIYVPEIRI